MSPVSRSDPARRDRPRADEVVLRVLVYSSDADTRSRVHAALGDRLHPDLPAVELIDVATAPALLAALDAGGVDLVILDGEAAPAGGLGMAKQVRDEYEPCPPLLVLIARAADRWLADWSRADAVAALPVDPLALPRAVARLLTMSPARRAAGQ